MTHSATCPICGKQLPYTAQPFGEGPCDECLYGRKRLAVGVVQYGISDPNGGGWAVYNGIEGWHFTILQSAATMFPTKESALAIITREYQGIPGLEVVEMESGQRR